MTEAQWPGLNPAWGRLVEQAWRALDDLREGGKFRPFSPTTNRARQPTEISSLIGVEAIFDLHDRAPEWARNVAWITDLYESLCADDQLEIIEQATEEIQDHSELVEECASHVTSDVGVSALPRLSPVATATLVATLTRAQLLPNRDKLFPDAPELITDPRLIATLILQSRVLTHGTLLAEMRFHPYALYQVRRSLWLLATSFGPGNEPPTALASAIHVELDRIRDKAVSLTEVLLARSSIQGVRDGEIVALIFCAALLALGPPDPQYVIEALSVAARAQSPRGDWPQGRRIGGHLNPDTERDQLFVSTHEVALAFAEAIMWLGQVPGASTRLRPEAISALELAVDYLRESRVEFTARVGATASVASPPIVGWSSTHVYGHDRIDTRATASALRLTVATRAISEQVRSVRALEEFDEVWDPAFAYTPSYLEWDRYLGESEPDSENPILPYLDRHFVKRVKEGKKDDRRPWARTEAMSAILFGPPGTTKTTIVNAMAQGLEWPLVTLSPGTFIRDGLENVEKRAIEVFSRLRDLMRVVVLFDECDELFRKRRSARGANENSDDNMRSISDEARSISAFMTASMLPKLQGLRDNGQIFFVIATNYFEEIDPAAKRIGRIDRVVGVGWPDEAQREHIIRATLSQNLPVNVLQQDATNEAISALAKATGMYVRGDLVELTNELANELPSTKVGVGELVRKIVDNTEPSIIGGDRRAFISSAIARSACHERGRGEMKTNV